MKHAVIFDMDGVLIDSQPLHYQIDICVLERCGHQVTLKDVTPYTGHSNQLRWPKYKAAYGLTQTVEELSQMAEQAMMEIFSKEELVPIEGIPALLQNIKEAGMHIGVASASPLILVQMVLERTGIGKYFDSITSVEEVKESKPAPDIYLCAAAKSGYTIAQCIAIEDSPAGIKAATSAGLTCIAYKNPNTAGQDFTLANHVVSHFDQCMDIIKAAGGVSK